MRKKLRAMYRDWFCNFLTVPRFAEYYGLTVEQAHRCINVGRRLHNRRAEMLKNE